MTLSDVALALTLFAAAVVYNVIGRYVARCFDRRFPPVPGEVTEHDGPLAAVITIAWPVLLLGYSIERLYRVSARSIRHKRHGT